MLGLVLFGLQLTLIGGIALGRYVLPKAKEVIKEQPMHLMLTDGQFNEFMAEQKRVNTDVRNIQERAIKDQTQELADYLTGGAVNYDNFNG